MKGAWGRCRARLGGWMRWLAGPLLRIVAVPPPPAPELPPAVAALLAGHPEEAALRAAARIETGAACPALAPLLALATARGARVEATILAAQGIGEDERHALVHAMIDAQAWRGGGRCP